MLKKRLVRLSIFLVPIIFIFSQCLNFKKTDDPRGDGYAGSATCVSCHSDLYGSYLHTAHFLSARPAYGNTIQGSFAKGFNEFVFTPNSKAVMEKRDTSFYQTGYENGKVSQSQRFDIAFGGIKGQTYAYWIANELFQLPISYDNVNHHWMNSPGYDKGRIAFERAIGVRCLDCHIAYAKQAPPDLPGFYTRAEGFEKSSMILNIDCERCHGPAAEHVKFQTENPGEKKAKYIISIKSLTRDQQINMCAICHSGGGNIMLKPTFGYKPDDTLSKYMKVIPSNQAVNYKILDVHGNQKALLESSKCFMNSNMTCNTCHDTHVNSRGNAMLYANKCQTCHNPGTHNQCKLTNQLSPAMLAGNCVSCHMPAFPSKLIIESEKGTLVHTHHIAVYPEETLKVVDFLKVKIAYKNHTD